MSHILRLRHHSPRFAIVMSVAILLAACGGDKKSASDSAQAVPAPSAPSTGGPIVPQPGGKVIVVELITDDKGNYFNPAVVKAKKGDVVRFALKIGVHNVDFLPDSNAHVAGLPKPSDMLQLPGQTFDVAVTFGRGTIYFQCDPHVALGMKGHLEIE